MAWLYDWECRHILRRTDQDIPFWLGAAQQANGLVLELACGTGRVTLPLAAAGIAIVGLDHDVAMLAKARDDERHQYRAQAPEAHEREHRPAWPLLIAADMRHFAFAARFGLVFVAYNSLQLLPGPTDMSACLNRARQHLAPGGLIGIEVTDFQVGGADGPVGGLEPDCEPLGEAEGVQLAGSLAHDLAARTSRYQRRFSGEGWTVADEVVVRSVDQGELSAILTEAGLTATTWRQIGPTVRVFAAGR